jgi:hypothetical protein
LGKELRVNVSYEYRTAEADDWDDITPAAVRRVRRRDRRLNQDALATASVAFGWHRSSSAIEDF